KINGYRIVIFFDQDKSIVSQQKANFLSRYHGHKAYIDYVAPNYRVRVGNFRTKLEAEALKAELLTYFPTAVVVEDHIQLPELPAASIGE
ncbi:SPOR domain-containing protein, partial [Crocinitomix sp.]|nr:SPOR domain-containing protein [Crocinitomix sp.]